MTKSSSPADSLANAPCEASATAHSARPSQVAVPFRQIAGQRSRSRTDLEVNTLADIPPAPIEWLWPGRLAIGKLTVLAGERGVGKSLTAMSIAATVTAGGVWPCREGRTDPGNVILLSAEDGLADTMRPRIGAAGGDPERIDVVHALAVTDAAGRRGFDLARDLAALEGLILARGGVRLVIIDPVGCYLRAGRRAEHDVLEAIADVAARRRVAVLLIAPPGKGRSIHRYGGGAFVAAALALVTDPENPARRLLLPARSNLTRSSPGLAFRFGERAIGGMPTPCVSWEAETVPAPVAEAMLRPDRTGTVKRAMVFLRGLLAEGIVPAREIEARAVATGLLTPGQPITDSRRFREARAALSVTSERIAGDAAAWAWRLPPHRTIH